MRICEAAISECIGCNKITPKNYGDLCRFKAQNIIDCLIGGELVGYSYETKKFYRKISGMNSVYELDDDCWDEIKI